MYIDWIFIQAVKNALPEPTEYLQLCPHQDLEQFSFQILHCGQGCQIAHLLLEQETFLPVSRHQYNLVESWTTHEILMGIGSIYDGWWMFQCWL